MAVTFTSNIPGCKIAIALAGKNFLTEVGGVIQGQAQRNSRVDTGQLKSSWDYKVKDDAVYIGSPLENAIWEEFGTGIYAEDNNGAASGKGRKTPWNYIDRHGQRHYTRGKTANHTLQRAFDMKKNSITEEARKAFGAIK